MEHQLLNIYSTFTHIADFLLRKVDIGTVIFTMILLWCYPDFMTIYNDLTTILPWFYQELTMMLPRFYQDFTMLLPRFYHDFTMMLQWFYQEFPTIVRGFPDDFPMISRRCSEDFPMISEVSRIFPILLGWLLEEC